MLQVSRNIVTSANPQIKRTLIHLGHKHAKYNQR